MVTHKVSIQTQARANETAIFGRTILQFGRKIQGKSAIDLDFY